MAKFNSAWLLRKRPFRSLTGVEAETFHEMIRRLRPHWRERVIDSKNRDGRPWGIGGLEEHLLVLLILYRCCVTQDFLACLYQVDQAAISRSLCRIEKLKKHANLSTAPAANSSPAATPTPPATAPAK